MGFAVLNPSYAPHQHHKHRARESCGGEEALTTGTMFVLLGRNQRIEAALAR
jgi:hypothetical protein